MLFNPGDTFEQEEEDRRRLRWIKRIRANLEDLLHKHGSFVVGDYQAEVLAGVPGEARERHVRAAIKELFREGKTTCNGVGNVRDLPVTGPTEPYSWRSPPSSRRGKCTGTCSGRGFG